MDAPSGLRPPSQSPAGSFTDWILARIIDLQTTSLMTLCRACLPAPDLQASPCKPSVSMTSPHTQSCWRNNVRPILSPTAMRTSSSLSRSPQDWIGMAFSQSPECGAQAAKNLARSRGETHPEKRDSRTQPTTTLSQARCLWDIGSVSETEDVLSDQNAKQSSNAVSVNSEMRGTMRFCKANVPTAEAKKADDASEYAMRTPSPPSLTGKLARCHCECVKDTLRMPTNPSRRMLSKRSSKTLSKHLAVLKICISFGTLTQFLIIQRA